MLQTTSRIWGLATTFSLLAASCLTSDAAHAEQPVSFELDVQPILTARGCNAGACHGKQRGQNGFQLSLLGFDSDFDHEALTMQARGRRIFPAAPEQSLLLLKGTAAIPHGGGARLAADGDDYETLRHWIAQGARRRLADEPKLLRIQVEPDELFLQANQKADLRVTAFYSDGSRRDVTGQTQYQSNESAIASVDEQGQIVAGPIPGETTVMSRYMYQIAVTNVAIPLQESVAEEEYDQLPRNNFIDEHVWQKLKSLRITPSAPAGDARFLRRVYIDLIGRLPSVEEARAFLGGDSPARRAELVNELLTRREYADHWANKWADLLRPNPYRVGIKATFTFDGWIRDQFRENRPHDQFVYDLVTAQGSTWQNGAATLFRDRRSPDELTPMIAQLFLGIRLDCAKCHHHPFEKWGQDDFYSFAAYFARVGRKGRGLSPPISGDEEIVHLSAKGSVEHPLTGETMAPRPLFGEAPPVEPDSDPRAALATWMTKDENEFFAQVQVNRIWADLMGRGLVEPVDDLRSTNPPTNAPLLSALADEFRRLDYDNKALLRTIVSSHAYQLSSLPNERNASDTRNYSRHYRQRLRAEVLALAIEDITGVPTDYTAMPSGSRPNQIWTHRIDSLFLDTFGRPNENQDPPCERLADPNVTQTLHLMNAPALSAKITSENGRAATLAKSDLPAEKIIEELYLAIYSRFPSDEELDVAIKAFQLPEANRRHATEDLMWALLNTPEFMFKD